MMVVCKECERRQPEGATYCGYCGTRMKGRGKVPSSTQLETLIVAILRNPVVRAEVRQICSEHSTGLRKK